MEDIYDHMIEIGHYKQTQHLEVWMMSINQFGTNVYQTRLTKENAHNEHIYIKSISIQEVIYDYEKPSNA